MTKMWKIGTNVETYLVDARKMFSKLGLEKFKIYKNDYGNGFMIQAPNKPSIFTTLDKSESTISQLFTCLISLGIIEIENKQICLEKRDSFFNSDFLYRFNSELRNTTNFDEVIVHYLDGPEFNKKLSWYRDNLQKIKYDNFDEEDLETPFTIFNEQNFLTTFFISVLNKITPFSDRNLKNCFNLDKKDFEKAKQYYENILTPSFFSKRQISFQILKRQAILFLFEDEDIYAKIMSEGTTPRLNRIIVKKNESDKYKRQVFNLKDKLKQTKNPTPNLIVAEIVSFGSLIENSISQNQSFKVPIYQRHYKWGSEDIKKLFNDILGISKKQKQYHFMGNLVVNWPKDDLGISVNKKPMKIIDGQQRFTSLLIILKALYDVLRERDIEPDPFINQLFVLNETRNSNKMTFIFEHLNYNHDFQDYKFLMISKFNEIDINKSTIYRNYQTIKNVFNENDGLSDQELFDFTESLLSKIYFTLTKDTSQDEFAMFENMNTHKVELDTIELIKNLILMYVDDATLSIHEDKLGELFDNLILKKFEDKKSINDGKINSFIATYVKSYRSVLVDGEDDVLREKIIRAKNNKNELYEIFKLILLREIKILSNNTNRLTFDTYGKLIKNLSWNIDLFLEMTESKLFLETSSFLYNIGDILFMFGTRNIYNALVMTLIKQYLDSNTRKINDLNKLRELLFEIENYEVRFQTVLYRGQSMSESMDRILTQVIDKGLNLTKENLHECFNNKRLVSTLTLPVDNIFEKYLVMPIEADKLVTKLIFRVNYFLDNHCSMSIRENHRYSCPISPSREHIMPQKYNEWEKDLRLAIPELSKDRMKAEHLEHVALLGNALILNKNLNSEASNANWQKKIQIYKRDSNVLNMPQYKGYTLKKVDYKKEILLDLESINQWDFDTISKRTHQLKDIILDIYK
ncbi:uncharacterized protein with ParB-like and HNH nuclease domain [Entomoplasma freundtii]|uniref:Uncharacterized protein n=1 Tax=Entomoplasma freundtii TaxID=74700 RepID=A0A2K8NRY3_9MOLU|nr:DUF262 domain-containing protein [Entomoplasma freundtii]ATZ16306.1 hypothetical protein EFREU_v1c02800 [Entomoplasma freundtii]TDY56792.1 uncharacterized protein with ParB-like and HNH nuclease domain [Entomoplasma freundtii]